MAKIGLKNFRYAVFSEVDGSTGMPKYTTASKSLGKAIDCKVTVETNSATLYADDTLVESDYSFKSGTFSATVDDENSEFSKDALGHSVSTENEDGASEVGDRSTDDEANYLSIARIIRKMNNGKISFKVEYLWKVKFKEPSAEETTKGENLEFKTTALEGTISALENGKWSHYAVFDTYEKAVADIDKTFKVAV